LTDLFTGQAAGWLAVLFLAGRRAQINDKLIAVEDNDHSAPP
jgi:hypothetical protein